MKKLLALIVFAMTATAFAAGFTDLEKVEINPADSKLTWLGKKVTGEHTGNVKITKGALNFKGEVLTGGEFEIDMTTITNTDVTDPDFHKKLVDHLGSPDFFDIAKHKTAALKIKSAKKVKDNNYKITADLTIKGVTQPVSFDADVTKTKSSAKIVFDRTKYGIKFKSGKFDPGLGDKLIYDDVTITVDLVQNPKNTPAPKNAVK